MPALLLDEEQVAIDREWGKVEREAAHRLLKDVRDLDPRVGAEVRELVRHIVEQAIAGAVGRIEGTARLWQQFRSALRAGAGGERVRTSLHQARSLFDSCDEVLALATEFAELATRLGLSPDRLDDLTRASRTLGELKAEGNRVSEVSHTSPPAVDADALDRAAGEMDAGRFRTPAQIRDALRTSAEGTRP